VKETLICFVNKGELVFDFTDSPGMLKQLRTGLPLHRNGKPQGFSFRRLMFLANRRDERVTLKQWPSI